MELLKNKKAVIFGIASKLSIASGIAHSFSKFGADIILCYQNEKLKSRAVELAQNIGLTELRCIECDLSSDDQINQTVEKIKQIWDEVDIVIHAVAFAPREALKGGYVEATTRENFNIAHEVSSYTFTALAKAFRPILSNSSSLLTLTYLGSVRTMPNYNVMGLAKASLEANVRFMAYDLGKDGIRVNAISAGPIKTLAAAGISDFNKLLKKNEQRTPIKRNTSLEDVGNAASFLCSDLASGISAEILYVDGGFNTTAIEDTFATE